ncbi:ABC transporter substrate-binding protein [Pseudovibrio sp. Tun.PSC04-5.I4]|uniref:ABC transporter substrate-binding protein n=1 Tax=Pseudovibrio sp. Tun.PSC04-5.I4 TaxID=1798213 RepID=UPI001FCCB6E1|nr:ABC transporter substrate-binding protein [Pseudovibrio sp. Tun.PSC04-5.I4]
MSVTALVAVSCTFAQAGDLEVTHWWTSAGEAAAVAELANSFDATGNKWVDGAIAGSGKTALPIIVSRILGGDPMGATMLNHGRQAEELIQAGLMMDLSDIADAEGWKEAVYPPSLLDACTYEGKIYCAPVNIHSWQWMWLSNKAFKDAGVAVPKDWNEFVAASPELIAAGKIPLAMGQQAWQQNGAFNVLTIGIGGIDLWKKINIEKDAEAAAGPEMTKVFEAAAVARDLSKDSKVQDWNSATNLVITGKAGAQILGDWVQGEFQIAGQTAGEDYTCLPGLGLNEILDTNGDAFYFPVNKDPEVTKVQKELAKLLLSKETQVSFNLKKGSLPVRGDVDLGTVNDCMKKGLEILAAGKTLPSGDMVLSTDTSQELQDLLTEFWSDPSYTAKEAQKGYADIIARAD